MFRKRTEIGRDDIGKMINFELIEKDPKVLDNMPVSSEIKMERSKLSFKIVSKPVESVLYHFFHAFLY